MDRAQIVASEESRWASGDARTVLVVAGTRPECIKVAPVVRALRAHSHLRAVVVNSGQHACAVERTFDEFELACDHSLAPLPELPHLAASCAHLQLELENVIRRVRPGFVLVQGDTLTTLAGARAASARGVASGHIEAGLRTPAALDPFPEEWIRRRIARHAALHFTPTLAAASNLRAEGIAAEAIHVTGNAGVDALAGTLATLAPRSRSKELVLVTLHR